MDIRKIKKLIEMLQESDLSEIEVSQGEESVRISRGNNNSVNVNTPQANVAHSSNPDKKEIQSEPSGKSNQNSYCWNILQKA